MKIGYAMTEAIRSIRRVPLMTIVSVGTIGLSLMVFGLFLLVTYNVEGAVHELRAKVDVEAFLEEEVEEEALSRLRAEVATVSGVQEVHYISKEQARVRFAADFGDSLLSLLEGNPLPASLLIVLTEDQRTAEGAARVAGRIEPMTGIDDVVYGQGWVERFDRFILGLSAISILIGLVVSLASVFVISNTVKLTVWARRDAVEIMKLVGATDSFVKMPFLIEGTFQGLVGAVVAVAILYSLYGYVAPGLGEVVFLPVSVCAAILVMGAVLGGIGSQLSLRQFLEV
jgi:cell division transport system permease protein